MQDSNRALDPSAKTLHEKGRQHSKEENKVSFNMQRICSSCQAKRQSILIDPPSAFEIITSTLYPTTKMKCPVTSEERKIMD